MDTRELGRTGPRVSALALGCMGMSDFYGPADRDESIATLHAALDHGITMLDTGDFYGMGDNEMLIRDALRGRARDQVLISVKFGALRDPAGGFAGYDARPVAIRNFVAYSLKRLGTDYIDIYRPARVDPAVPIEETIGAIADLVKAGYVRHIGLSEAGVDTIRRAAAVARAARRTLEHGAAGRARFPRGEPALPGREPRAQPRACRRAARHRRREGQQPGAGRDRVGAVARRRYRAVDRRAQAHAASGRVAGC
ncbi:aldo/keto reductase [Burkholderia aenigmatica]|uniref:Aldo/keto reductase n=1 Tax=Burkholderia aenigmatica TaxID=2015348 RepID=A0ABY6XKS3_9BURK|nr:aldo/keto reductase [Burkholderia aenigmatica]VWC71969.1 aldo/keto reductase [Burkholderia aenigmatica]